MTTNWKERERKKKCEMFWALGVERNTQKETVWYMAEAYYFTTAENTR